MVLERITEVASSAAPRAISIKGSAGFVDVTALRRHEGVVAFKVPRSCLMALDASEGPPLNFYDPRVDLRIGSR